MIQILTKIVERKSLGDSWGAASMGFLFSKNRRPHSLNLLRTPALFFIFIFTVFSSVNVFAFEGEPHGKSPVKTTITPVAVKDTKLAGDPPKAKLTLTSTNENTPLSGDLKLRVTDSDDPISSLVFTQLGTMAPIEGTFTLRANGTYTYTPAFNFFGVTAVTYKVCDPGNLCDTSSLIITVFSVNDPPIAVDDFNSTVEDMPVSGTVATGDFDPDNLPSELTYSLDGPVPATTGVVVMNPNGSYTYTPALNYTGPAVIKYKVCDPGGMCGMGTLTINFTPVNDPPVATNSSVTTVEDTPKSGDLKPQVSDPDNITASLVFTQIGVIMDSEGRFTLNPDGTYTFVPAPNFSGTVVVNYTVCDPSNLCATAKLTITVSPINDKPIVTPITPTTTPEDIAVKVCTMLNDPDLGDTFTASACGAKNGIVSPVLTGKQLCITYTPNLNFNGIDTACVRVCDAAGACDTIKIPLVITPVNDAPKVDMPPAIVTIEDTPAQVCSTIRDVDGDMDFTATICDVTNGVAFPFVTGDQLCVAYTPFENFSGTDTVCVIVCDLAGGCDTIKVPVTVGPIEDTPTVDPLSISTTEDTPVTACTTIQDGDAGNTFTATLCGVKNGIATPTIKNVNELCIAYTPNANFTGQDTICVTVCDNTGLCETVEILVDVTPTNDKPTVTPLSISTVEDTPKSVCTTINDIDAGDTFTATVCGVKNGTAVPTITGNQLCVLYTPKGNYSGVDTVCIIVCDAAGACDTVKIPVTVSPVSDKPTVTPTTITTPEEIPATVCTPISDGDAGDTFTATLCAGIKNGTATATITPSADATGSQLCVTYRPNPNYNGPDTVCVTVCDQTGLCEVVRIPVVVTPVNDPPTVNPVSIATAEETPATVVTTINDIDLGDTFTATLCGVKNGTASPTVSGNQLSVLYTPNPNYNGIDTVCVTVCDAAGACTTVNIPVTVSPINDKPTVTPTTISTLEDTPATVCTTILDADAGDTFTATACGAKNGTGVPTVTGNQLCVLYTPNANYNGVDTVCITVCDLGGLCEVVKIPVVVTPVNDAPTVNPTSIATTEDSPATVCTTINDIDSGDTFTAASCGAKNGTGVPTVTGNQLCVLYTPNGNYSGVDTVCVTVCDAAGACATVKIPVIVTPINDKPTVTPLSISTPEDTPATVCTTINDADLGDTFTATACGAKNGTGVPTVTGNQLCVLYTPNANYSGVDTVCVTVCDAAGVCETVKIPVVVTPVNDKPTVTPTSIATVEDIPATVCTTINDIDAGEAFTFTPCGVKNGKADISILGNQLCVTYTPNLDYNGLDTVCVNVCDLGGLCETVKIPVEVAPISDKPFVAPTRIVTPEDTPATVCTTISDSDVGEVFSVTTCGDAKNGTAVPTITGSKICVLYTPNANYNGPDTACFRICDLAGNCDTLIIPITVTSVNDKPTVVQTTSTVLEDNTVNVCTTINDADLGETFTATKCGVKNGTADATITGNQICVKYTPNANYNGKDTLCYVICDAAGACDTLKIPVVVSPVNDKPTVVQPTKATGTLEDTPVKVCTTINDVDVSETFNATLCGAKNGTATAVITGNEICVNYIPTANYNGVDTVCFVVCDSGNACDTLKIPVFVTPVNDRPKVDNPLSISTLEDLPVSVCTTVSDADKDAVLSVEICGAQHGVAFPSLTGNDLCVAYTPLENYNGLDTVCVLLCDEKGACDTVKIPVIIQAVNDEPMVNVTTFEVLKDSTRQFCYDIEDPDMGDKHTVTICGVEKGTAIASVSNGQLCITYSTPFGYTGADSICIILCDSSNACVHLNIPVRVFECDDKLAPVMTCPAKIEVSIMGTVLTDPNNFIDKVRFSDNCHGLRFDFNDLKATDDCGTPFIRQISGLTSDSVYIEGKHYMRFEAVDVSGKKTPCQVEIEVSPINLITANQMSVCPNESLNLRAKTYNGATYKWTGPRNVSVDSILLAIPRTAGESVEVFTVGATFGACTFKDSIIVTFRVRPVVNDDLFKVSMNTELKNSVLVNDTTITLQKYTVKLNKPVADGKVAFNNDGTFTFNPSNNFTGTEIFTYQVCPVDCPNTCETATATIKVANSKFANKGTNVITPNNDGLNDALEIEGLDPNAVNNQSEIVVYNQWGNVVYRTTSYKNDWRGTFNNNPLPVGTYYFLFKKSPDAVPVKDFVTIIR